MKTTERMLKVMLLAMVIVASVFYTSQASPVNSGKLGALQGKVVDSETKKPIEYANVRLFSVADSSLVTGTITSIDGVFSLKKIPIGEYWVEISFIGFDKVTQKISITKENLQQSLSEVVLSAASTELDDVTVVGEKTHIKYEIDKQVINVGKDATASGGTAVEVLENTPSVKVDGEGEVSLRGSKDFTVLINGKPTQLSGTDALKQVPANTIEKIELVTNPSAKYEAEGTSGIINIITKKNTLMGLNGLFNTSVGTGNKYSANATINYKMEKLNVFGGVEYSDNHNMLEIGQSSVTYGQPNFYLENEIENAQMNDALVYNLGFDYDFNERSSLSVSGKIGHRGYDTESNSESEKYFEGDVDVDSYRSHKYMDVYGDIMEYTVDYRLKFADNHDLSVTGQYQSWDGYDAEDLRNEFTTGTASTIDEMHYYNKTDFNYSYRLNVDYKRPLGEKGILEAGYQGKYNDRHEEFRFEDYDLTTELMVNNPFYSNDLHYERFVHAAYATYANEFKGFKYKVGLRSEYTDRVINIEKSDADKEEYIFNNAPDLFPSVHISKDLPKGHMFQLSYSRRITRPNSWLLNNNPRYFDADNIFYGSPYLLPQYTDSYELNYRKPIKKVFLSVQTFYRNTKNVFTQERKPLGNNKFSHNLINSNRDQTMGAEISGSIDAAKWLKVNIGTNLYNKIEDGLIDGVNKTVSNFMADSYINTTFILKWGTRLQGTCYYSAPQDGLYGDRGTLYVFNFGANQSFLKGKLNAGLSVRNAFNTLDFDYNTYDNLGESTYNIDIEGPVVQLNLSYRFNDFKNKQRGKHDDSEFTGGGF